MACCAAPWPPGTGTRHSNLAFNALLESSEALTEALRDGKPPQPGEDELVARVKADYERTAQAIRAYQEGGVG